VCGQGAKPGSGDLNLIHSPQCKTGTDMTPLAGLGVGFGKSIGQAVIKKVGMVSGSYPRTGRKPLAGRLLTEASSPRKIVTDNPARPRRAVSSLAISVGQHRIQATDARIVTPFRHCLDRCR
jgi:hypothetical protein